MLTSRMDDVDKVVGLEMGAHELRTPLSIARGHIEAMLDGVFEMTPDNLAVVHEETLLLGRLMDDLRTLSLTEAGQLSLNRVAVNLRD